MISSRAHDTMTRNLFEAKATEYGYTPEEIADLVKVFREEEEALGAPPIPYDQIPLSQQIY